MTYFAKPTNLTRIETMRQQNRHIDSWRFSQKWQIWENGELSKNPSTSWQNLKWGGKDGNIDKRQISTNMASEPKIHQGFVQIFKWGDKKGHVDSWRFLGQCKFRGNGEFGKKLSKVWLKFSKRWQKGASWQLANITNMTNWATIYLRFAKIQMRGQTRHVDNCEFYENDKFGKNL